MINFVPHQQLDTDKWDACIKADTGKTFYGLSWYLDMLVPEWDALVLGNYEAVFPLVKNKKYGIHYLNRPYGVQQLGVFSKSEATPEMVRDFIKAIPSKYKFVDIFLNVANPIGLLNAKVLHPNVNLELNLHRKYQEIYEGYNKRTIRNLKKAKKHNHRVFEHDSPDQLIQLFKLNRGQKTSLTEAHYNKMRQIMHVMLHKHRGYLWTIYDEHNSIIAGAFFVEIYGRITFLFSATNVVGKKQQAMTYLLDELFIARASDQVVFDFEGSSIKGLSEFYRGFGAEEKIYYNYKVNRLPWPLRWLKR